LFSSSELIWPCCYLRCLFDVYVTWQFHALILNVSLFCPSVNNQRPDWRKAKKEAAKTTVVQPRESGPSTKIRKPAARTTGIQGKCYLQTSTDIRLCSTFFRRPSEWYLHYIAQYLCDKFIALFLRIIQALTTKCFKWGMSVSLTEWFRNSYCPNSQT
jgi:hypothetical protein